MDNFKEWHPDGATIIVGEQTIVNPISLKLCCSKIIANVGNPIAYRGEAFICTQLDELLNKSVGVVTPSLGTMFGAENKAFQNTVERPKMAFLIADKVKLLLADKLSPQAKEIAFRAVDVWLDGVTPGDRQSAACTVHKNPSISRELPSELDTEQARKYFARAVAAGLMSEQYKWLASQSLLACFCREMSVNLDLGKGYSSEGQKRLSWKPFEALFNVKAKNLTTSLNDIKKTGQDPIGIEKVEAIFKD